LHILWLENGICKLLKICKLFYFYANQFALNGISLLK